MPQVNPSILKWARQTAGLSPSEAVAKLGLRDARGVEAVQRLEALEGGETPPTRPMLVKMAKKYRRPLLTFYLSQPPVKGDRGQDFRTLPDDLSETDEALLDALIRDVVARQSLVRAALEDEDDASTLSFVGSENTGDGVTTVLSAIQETLGFSLSEFRAAQSPDEAFQRLRGQAEEAGVFVLLLGNLGSHHTDIDVEVFRGFALADPVAPFVIINDHDSRSAWSFTLLHELAHLWLGETGVSAGRPERPLELFCNQVASECLLPARELASLELPRPFDLESTAEAIDAFASHRHVSRSMVAYKLHREEVLTRSVWQQLARYFRERWLEEQHHRRERGRESSGGPNYYVVRRHRLGHALVDVTARLLMAGAITTSKAGRVLGVKAKNVGSLIGENGPFSRAS